MARKGRLSVRVSKLPRLKKKRRGRAKRKLGGAIF
jgi:hypothetical protein